MTGLIRIPGSPPSNFDTGNGKTVVDLIDAEIGSEASRQIAAVEIKFTRGLKGQSFFVIPVGYKD